MIFYDATCVNKIMNMKNFIYSTVVLFFISINSFAQTPSWSVNENDFQYTMSFVAFVNLDGVTLSSMNDKVAAFVNGECRGVTNLTYVASEDGYFAYLTVFSNENNETLNFKIYNATNNAVRDVGKTKRFEINAHYGDLFQAYSIANPTLSNKAEIIDFNFNGVNVNSIRIIENQIYFVVDNSEDISNLNATFILSSGAKLFIGTTMKLSGINSIDFRTPVDFQVLSEDQSVLKQWQVSVNSSTGIASFYKKDAVCYKGGVIKVVFTEDNVDAVLRKSGIDLATQTINSGVTIFEDLEVGTYNILIGGNAKEITINLKE